MGDEPQREPAVARTLTPQEIARENLDRNFLQRLDRIESEQRKTREVIGKVNDLAIDMQSNAPVTVAMLDTLREMRDILRDLRDIMRDSRDSLAQAIVFMMESGRPH